MLKLKDGLENCLIYVPFENREIIGKFIDINLYKFMYDKYPDLFEIIDEKNNIINDISIENTESIDNINIEGEK